MKSLTSVMRSQDVTGFITLVVAVTKESLMTSDHDIKSNKQAREDAEAVVALIGESGSPGDSLRFWQELEKLTRKKINSFVRPPAEQPYRDATAQADPSSRTHRPMNAIQAKAFGEQTITFGTVCRGMTVEEAYDLHLSWLNVVAHGTLFARDLARYLSFRECNDVSATRDDRDVNSELADPVQASRPAYLDKLGKVK
jgi:hypothetical protein